MSVTNTVLPFIRKHPFATVYVAFTTVKGTMDSMSFAYHILTRYINNTETDGESFTDKQYDFVVRSQFEAFWGTLLLSLPYNFLRGALWPLDALTWTLFNTLRNRKPKHATNKE